MEVNEINQNNQASICFSLFSGAEMKKGKERKQDRFKWFIESEYRFISLIKYL